MLRPNDLKQQTVFSKYKENETTWYSPDWDYAICFDSNGGSLWANCEVNGITDKIKDLNSLEDLLETIDVLGI